MIIQVEENKVFIRNLRRGSFHGDGCEVFLGLAPSFIEEEWNWKHFWPYAAINRNWAWILSPFTRKSLQVNIWDYEWIWRRARRVYRGRVRFVLDNFNCVLHSTCCGEVKVRNIALIAFWTGELDQEGYGNRFNDPTCHSYQLLVTSNQRFCSWVVCVWTRGSAV